MSEVTYDQWESYLNDHPEAHLLQTPAWGKLKSHFGWKAYWVQEGESGAQVLIRKLPLGFSFAYIPKGPLGQDWPTLWPSVDALCSREWAIFLKVEPDSFVSTDHNFLRNCLPGFRTSAHAIQPPRTILVDLNGGEESVLSRMRQKARYNVRLAEKKGVIVRQSDDTDLFDQLMRVTGERDGFGVHNLAYYRAAYRLFAARCQSVLLIAEYEAQPLAAAMIFKNGKRAWYFYGASNNLERQRMPAYLLQWEAMRWAMSNGCTQYDLWGVPDADEAELEANFADRSDGLWGVYRFKRGFGGQVVRSPGAWDKVYNPVLYRLYQLWMRGRGTAE
jgi:lipid II:glycine glycyltransferase (peptidoglycan interpeptide bridge formation enzyme)